MPDVEFDKQSLRGRLVRIAQLLQVNAQSILTLAHGSRGSLPKCSCRRIVHRKGQWLVRQSCGWQWSFLTSSDMRDVEFDKQSLRGRFVRIARLSASRCSVHSHSSSR
ncbi:hypothetical protein CBR_g23914 [Chara braunii]|uniref:Uncharacterized protein n=1 Tax=Chara braunii TaxID=69332 RepID=A0A388L585_CHABU|nr:hypothetical protein CBR_g23914 [Chara braunii]|eukprot:GBG77466.1 hypothetical protein CBR_g23914 [Chara braunii]